MADDVTFDVADEPLVPLSVTDPSSESADFAIGDAIIEAVSPTVEVEAIAGGHEVTITDINGEHTFDVLDGEDGEDGATGPAGPGVPTGGTAGQVLTKSSATDYDAAWATPSAADLTGTLPVAHGGTGATTAAGALTALGAASAADLSALDAVVDPIGTALTTDISTAVSVANSTWKSIGSIVLTAGTWELVYNVTFPSNATGRRHMTTSSTQDAAGNATELRVGQVTANAVDGGSTAMHGSRFMTAAGTYYLNVWQNSGSALNVTGFMRAVRIK